MRGALLLLQGGVNGAVAGSSSTYVERVLGLPLNTSAAAAAAAVAAAAAAIVVAVHHSPMLSFCCCSQARGGVAVKIFEQEQAAGSGTDAAAPTSPRRIKPKRWPPNVERSRFLV